MRCFHGAAVWPAIDPMRDTAIVLLRVLAANREAYRVTKAIRQVRPNGICGLNNIQSGIMLNVCYYDIYRSKLNRVKSKKKEKQK